ncbi:TonB-dependent receptor domain-containing protein [Halopseudomonas sp.]|uniref:TonB-dependent receptor domain-containing protein n=1 Tax=Halopseudomonas sp. TaxID=2901191 RepID=UPI00311F91B5
MYKSLLIIPGLLACAVAQANDALSLPDSIITASRQVEERAETSAANTVFTRDDIDRLQPQDLPDLLTRVPGLHISRSGGIGSLTSIFLRGTSSAQTLVLVDGQRIAGASAGLSSLEYMQIDQVERVEVVRGGRSALYGSDAIGGVIQIFTRRGDGQGLNPRVAIAAGSHGTWRRSAGLSGGDERTHFNLSAALDEVDGFERTTLAGSDDSAYRNKSASLSLSHQLTGSVEVGISGMHQEGKSEYDYNLSPAAFAYTDFSVSTAQTYLQVQANDVWRSRLEAGHSEDRQTGFDPYGGSVFNTYRDQLNWLNYLTLGGGHQLTGGLEWYKDTLHSSNEFTETSRSNKAAFIQHQFDSEHFGTELGLRHDDNQQFGSNNSWNAALTLHVNKDNDLILSYSEAFRAPTFNDLYYPDDCFPGFGCTIYADPNLKPETAKSYEAQWRSQLSDSARLELSIYSINLKDAIVTNSALDGNQAGSPNPFQMTNIDAARINGFEAVYSQQLLDWQGTVAYSLVDARNRSGGGADGNRLARRPKNSLSVDLDRQFGDWSVGAGWQLVSDSYNDLANSREIPGYGVVDLRSTWQASDSLRFNLSVKNLLDRDYYTAGGSAYDAGFNQVPFRYEEGGRTLLLGATWAPQL